MSLTPLLYTLSSFIRAPGKWETPNVATEGTGAGAGHGVGGTERGSGSSEYGQRLKPWAMEPVPGFKSQLHPRGHFGNTPDPL